jgi:hypothetical protein
LDTGIPVTEGLTKPRRTANYLLRLTPEEKAVLEQKVRVAAALGETPISLADALRTGAGLYLDDLIEQFKTARDATGPAHSGLES